MNNTFELINERLSNIECLLLDIKHSPRGAQDNIDLLTITQAGELINLTVPTIYSLVSKKLIPHNKKGKRLYFLKSELLDWVKSGRKKTISESEANPESHLATPKQRMVIA